MDGHPCADFLECITTCDLQELQKTRCHFTWTNNQDKEERIWRKLDRCLVNCHRPDVFGDSDYPAMAPSTTRITKNCLRRKNFDAKIAKNSSQNDEHSLFDFLATNSSQKIKRKDFSSQKNCFATKFATK